MRLSLSVLAAASQMRSLIESMTSLHLLAAKGLTFKPRVVPIQQVLAAAYEEMRQIAEEIEAQDAGFTVRLDEEVTPESLRRTAARELDAAVVMASPAAARRHGVRIDALRDEPLLAALSLSHEYASAPAIPVGAFVAEVVMVPREPQGQVFNAWFKAVLRTAGFELDPITYI